MRNTFGKNFALHKKIKKKQTITRRRKHFYKKTACNRRMSVFNQPLGKPIYNVKVVHFFTWSILFLHYSVRNPLFVLCYDRQTERLNSCKRTLKNDRKLYNSIYVKYCFKAEDLSSTFHGTIFYNL